MRNFFYAARQVFKPRGANLVKLLCLSLALFIGGTLAARVALDRSSDGFYPDVERLYRIESTINYAGDIQNDEMVISPLVVAMRDQLPEIESATRCSKGGGIDYNNNGQFFNLQTLFVDSLFFDVLGFEIMSGNPSSDLSVPGNAFISRSYAKTVFADVNPVGKTLLNGDELITICGVFQDVPVNCHLSFDIAVAPASFFTSWDGGECYYGYFKLHRGVNPNQVTAAVPNILSENMDIEGMRAQGIEVGCRLVPITDILTRHTTNINIVMSLLALVLILVGGLNYVLLTLSSLSGRAREIGVHKASGATAGNVFALVLWETVIYIILSIFVAAIMLILFRSWIETMTGGYEYLFSLSNLWSFALVAAVLFVVAGIAPAWSFSRISVTEIFRRYIDRKNGWKRVLLFAQFMSAAFIVSFTIVIFLQYNKMVNRDLGYDTGNVGYVNLSFGSSIEPYRRAADEIARLPFVRTVALANSLPMLGTGSGMTAFDVESGEKIVGCGKLQTEPAFFDLLGISIVDGRVFESSDDKISCVMDESAAATLAAKGNRVVGFNFFGDGELQTVGGVARNIRFGSAHHDSRAVVYTALRDYNELYLLFKLDHMSAAELKEVDARLRALFPNRDFKVHSYDERQTWLYLAEKQFRDVVVASSLILLIITVVGVVGYMATEIRRRSREIAVRKVFGSTSMEVVVLLLRSIVILGLAASVAGTVVSYVVGSYWQEQFALKADLDWWIFALGAVLIVILIVVCVFVQTWRIACEKPVVSIKSE